MKTLNLHTLPYFSRSELENGMLLKEIYVLNTNNFQTEIKVEDSPPQESADTSVRFEFRDGIFFILLALIVMIAYVKISGKNYLQRIFTSVTNFSYSNSFFKEKNLAHSLYNVILVFVFGASFAIFMSEVSDYYQLTFFQEQKWLQLLIYFSFILIMLLIHSILYLILGFITQTSVIVYKYLFFLLNLVRVTAVINVFLLFGSVFSSGVWQTIFIWASFILFITAFLVRLFRILLIFFKNRFSLYYMILYFCSLEIVPVILFIKLFDKYIA